MLSLTLVLSAPLASFPSGTRPKVPWFVLFNPVFPWGTVATYRSGQAYTTFKHTTVMLTGNTVQVRMDAMQCRERTWIKSERM